MRDTSKDEAGKKGSGEDAEGRDSRVEVADKTRIVLRPLATPLPMAFFAFGIASFVQSLYQLGVIPQSETQTFALLVGLFVFPVQLVASILAFLSRETLGASALGLFSFSWLAVSVLTYVSEPGATTVTFGVFQLSLAAALALLGVVGLSGKPLIAAIILVSSLRYALNGVFELSGLPVFEISSGIFGFAIFAFALYGGLALALEDTRHRPVLPFGRRGEALEAIEGDFADQIGPIEREAGVRKQL